tara:strand:+ start:79 stop:777 length:699 start_codon:yes stop_codon:yes gene_type:complete
MKLLSTWLLASALVTFNFTGTKDDINYRPYISTNLAKVIMTEGDDEIVEEKCDGSGWITHGDGHKTECPGCSACQKNIVPDPTPEPEPTKGCQCGCGKEECKCQENGQCFPLQEDVKKKESSQDSLTSLDDPEYYIYHFGAKWCGPCEKMKQQTWASRRVKEAIEDKNAKLIIYDEANPEHKKFFLYYKVKYYPTIIFVDKDELSKPLHRSSGFVDATKMTKTINEKFKNEQ